MDFTEFQVTIPAGRLRDETVTARVYEASGGARSTLVLAHGAGAPQTHPFMVAAASAIAERGTNVVTFNFGYMEARRRVPDRAPALEACWLSVLHAVRSSRGADVPVFIGGKSMGGRMASHVAAHHANEAGPIAGLVFLGYPLHPPGRPNQLRDAHLTAVVPPMLFVQGSRDEFGTPGELAPILSRLGGRATLYEVEGGDHSFGLARGGGRRREGVLAAVWDHVTAWMDEMRPGTRLAPGPDSTSDGVD